jgi:hypothetical protein
VHGDTLPETNETFFVTLRNASGVGIVRSEAVGVIDDDADQVADVGLAPAFTNSLGTLHDVLNVSNSGPSTATDIALRFTSTPSSRDSQCLGCTVPPIAAGASSAAFADYAGPPEQVYVSATATARQRDPHSSNNSISWTLNARRSMAMSPAYLTPGQTAAVVVVEAFATRAVTSSDPSVVAVPARVTAASDHLAGFTVTALKAGISSITVEGMDSPLLVTVVAEGAQPRWPGALTISTEFTVTHFDLPMIVSVTPTGRAPFSGATATGTVVVTAGTRELARGTISGTGTLRLPAFLPSRGLIAYAVTYSGDANFLPQRLDDSIFVAAGTAGLTASLQSVPAEPGTFSLTVRASGSPLAAPGGTVAVVNGATEIARLSLVASGSGTSTAQAILTNLPPSTTLTLNYSGDALYNEGSQQVRSSDPRRRAGRH